MIVRVVEKSVINGQDQAVSAVPVIKVDMLVTGNFHNHRNRMNRSDFSKDDFY